MTADNRHLLEEEFPIGSCECCCGRAIKKTEPGDWDHVDGTGMFCWPGARPGTPDAEYTAEPVVKDCGHSVRMIQPNGTYRCDRCGDIAVRDWSAQPGRTG